MRLSMVYRQAGKTFDAQQRQTTRIVPLPPLLIIGDGRGRSGEIMMNNDSADN